MKIGWLKYWSKLRKKPSKEERGNIHDWKHINSGRFDAQSKKLAQIEKSLVKHLQGD